MHLKNVMLYIVATPIGNLEDITLRALNTLKMVDIVACEDTRNTGFLLHHFEIKKPMLSYHSHSTGLRLEKIIEELKSGKSIALVSDAGTPGISDPGYALIKRALEEKIEVVPIP
jgi:16S rRNA (cytidine1402-2'-O)-methyltransferase